MRHKTARRKNGHSTTWRHHEDMLLTLYGYVVRAAPSRYNFTPRARCLRRCRARRPCRFPYSHPDLPPCGRGRGQAYAVAWDSPLTDGQCSSLQ